MRKIVCATWLDTLHVHILRFNLIFFTLGSNFISLKFLLCFVNGVTFEINYFETKGKYL